MYKLGLTQQCLFLDSEVGSGAVAELLSNPDSATFHLKQAKANIIKLDWKTSVEMAPACSSTSAIIDTNWLRVWEEVRDHGTYWTSILQKFYKLLTTTLFDDHLCPRCDQHIPISSSFVEHYTAVHCSSTTMFNTVLLDLQSGSFSFDLLHYIRTCLANYSLLNWSPTFLASRHFQLYDTCIIIIIIFWVFCVYIYCTYIYPLFRGQISNIKYQIITYTY